VVLAVVVTFINCGSMLLLVIFGAQFAHMLSRKCTMRSKTGKTCIDIHFSRPRTGIDFLLVSAASSVDFTCSCSVSLSTSRKPHVVSPPRPEEALLPMVGS